MSNWWRCFPDFWCFFYLHVISEVAARWAISATVIWFSYTFLCYMAYQCRNRIGIALKFFNFNLCLCIAMTEWFPFPSLTALTQFLFILTITGRPLFQCLMCVERYLAVVHPVIFLKYKPLRYRVICCTVLLWIFIFLLFFVLDISFYLNYSWYKCVCG